MFSVLLDIMFNYVTVSSISKHLPIITSEGEYGLIMAIGLSGVQFGL